MVVRVRDAPTARWASERAESQMARAMRRGALYVALCSTSVLAQYESEPPPRFAHAGHPRRAAPLGIAAPAVPLEAPLPFSPLLPPANDVNLHFLAHATTAAEAAQHATRSLQYQRRTYLRDADGHVRQRPESNGHPKPMVPGVVARPALPPQRRGRVSALLPVPCAMSQVEARSTGGRWAPLRTASPAAGQNGWAGRGSVRIPGVSLHQTRQVFCARLSTAASPFTPWFTLVYGEECEDHSV